MKKALIRILFLVTLFLLSLSRRGFSQSSTTMQDILQTATAKVVTLEDQDKKEVVNISMDLLVNKNAKTIWRYLDPAYTYTVMTIGDRRINKLKLIVYKRDNKTKEWNFVGETSAQKPELKLDPTDFEEYEFTISVDEFVAGNTAGHFTLILYHQLPEGVK